MALNFRLLHLMILSVLFAALYLDLSTAVDDDGDPNVGGYQPIKNLNDPLVQEIAKFAVDEINKMINSILKYKKVVKGESKVVSGTDFKLVIVAKEVMGGALKQYEVIVWDKPWMKFRKLTSFTEFK